MLPSPTAADRNVHDEVMWRIERPGGFAGPFVLVGEVLAIIDKEIHPVLVPFKGVDVEGCFRICNFGSGPLTGADRVIVILGVYVGVDRSGVVPDVFQDIDFTAGRPTDLTTVDAEHP